LRSATWVGICHDNLFLQHLFQNSCWSTAGFGWKTHFFIRGQLYRHKHTGRVYRALSTNHRMCAMWPMSRLSSIQPVVADEYGFGYFEATPCQMPATAACCWLPDTDSTTRPFHAAMLDWDEEWEAATCEAISPLGLVARGSPWRNLPKCICLLQTTDFQHPLAVAAAKSFLGCSKDDLTKLAKEDGIRVIGFLAESMIAQVSCRVNLKINLISCRFLISIITS